MSHADHFPTAQAPVANTHRPRRSNDVDTRLRVGFITHLDHVDDPAQVYAENLELIAELERLGYDSAWIATRHFHSGWSGLPSPFAFLGAAAARTSRIHLGTAVLPIVVDDPVRVAEEVAVLDHLAGNRLQLGLGKGVPSDAYHVFARWGGDRESDFSSKIDQLHWALAGSQVPGSAASIWPANPSLEGRLYHGTSTPATIRRAAELGDGFILERFGNGPERHPDQRAGFQERQAESVRVYREAFAQAWGEERTPYAVLSRSAWPAATNELAREEVLEATARWNAAARQVGRLPEGLSPTDELLADNVIWGTPREVADDLLADPTLALSDELLLGIHPGRYTLAEAVEKARVLLEEVYPLVQTGWLEQRAAVRERERAADLVAGEVA